MKYIALTSSVKNQYSMVSNVFIDTFMRDANGEFIKVYLYLLRCEDGNMPVTVSDIADKLNMTENDILRALKYWNSLKVLKVEYDGSTPVSICLCDLNQPVLAPVEEIAVSKEPAENKSTAVKRSYSPAEIRRLCEQEDIKELLYIIQKYMGAPLTPTETSTIIYIYSDLAFSAELIEYLIEYCLSGNHRSFNYICKVAMNWYDNGITTVAEAKETSGIRSSRNAAVFRSFGIIDRNVTPIESEFITRWFDEYNFSTELVSEACKKTILAVSKPNFAYAESILKKWHNAGITTLEDVKKLESGFRTKITVPVTSKAAPVQQSVNKFNNFPQRSYNFDDSKDDLIIINQ